MPEAYRAAARRLRRDARVLARAGKFQTASHLIGLAAECAVKDVVQRGGIRLDLNSNLRVHFPQLGVRLRQDPIGRHLKALQRALTSRFLDGWEVHARYDEDHPVETACNDHDRWARDADALFHDAGLIA